MPPNYESESPHYGLNPQNWQENSQRAVVPKKPEEITRDITYFGREARDASFNERVSPVVISLLEFSKLVKPGSILSTDIATAKIYEWACKDSPAIKFWTNPSPTSKEILKELLSFPDFNSGSVMVWISPKGTIYKEARVNLYQTIEVNDAKYLFFFGIPSDRSDEECLKFYCKLTPYTTENTNLLLTNDIEELRVSPISLKTHGTNSLTGFFKDKFHHPEVWKAIASGQVIKDTLQDFEKNKPIVEQHYDEIISVKTESDFRRVGTLIELEMQARGNYALLSNAHGELYSSSLFNPNSGISFLLERNQFYQPKNELTTETRVHCGECGRYHKGEKFSGNVSCPKTQRND